MHKTFPKKLNQWLQSP